MAQSSHHRIINQTKQEKTDALVVAKIRALPEVKQFLHIANKSELPDVMIDDTPDSTNNWRYRIKVGYSKYMFCSVLIFNVDPKTLTIYYEDFMDESVSEITLQQWRRWRHDPRFNYLHTFKHGKLVALAK
jgi:hypothetical protein